MKEIKITCESNNFLDFEDLVEFQGDLKSRNDNQIDKIVRSIMKYGFAFPFFVWKCDKINYVLDGHGRLLALNKLDELGYKIPKIPVIYVNCENEKSAKDLLLRLNSNYGKMTKESVLDFVGDFELNFDNFELPIGTMNFEKVYLPDDFEEITENKKNDNKYTLVICKHCGQELLIDSKGNIKE